MWSDFLRVRASDTNCTYVREADRSQLSEKADDAATAAAQRVLVDSVAALRTGGGNSGGGTEGEKAAIPAQIAAWRRAERKERAVARGETSILAKEVFMVFLQMAFREVSPSADAVRI